MLWFQASDPDVGDAGQLVYGLAADSPYLDVEPSTGLVYVLSVLGLSSGPIEVQVKVTDPAGLTAVTTVQVRRHEHQHSRLQGCREGSCLGCKTSPTSAHVQNQRVLFLCCPPGGGRGRHEQQRRGGDFPQPAGWLCGEEGGAAGEVRRWRSPVPAAAAAA